MHFLTPPPFLMDDPVPGIVRKEKSRAEYPLDSSATRLSRGDPVGFPSHPCGWFSIIVYLALNSFFKSQESFQCPTSPQMPKLATVPNLFEPSPGNFVINHHTHIHGRAHVHNRVHAHARNHNSRHNRNSLGRPRSPSASTPLILPQATFFSSFSPPSSIQSRRTAVCLSAAPPFCPEDARG